MCYNPSTKRKNRKFVSVPPFGPFSQNVTLIDMLFDYAVLNFAKYYVLLLPVH